MYCLINFFCLNSIQVSDVMIKESHLITDVNHVFLNLF